MNNSLFIIETLKQSAIALERQDQHTAISSLTKIANEVDQFKKEAHALEVKSKNDQNESIIKLSSIIKLKGNAHADFENTTLQLNEVKSQIAIKKKAIALLNEGNKANNQVLKEAEKQLLQNKNRIKELNDDSVGSIFLSIFTLGMDRAIKAISIEVDGVKNQIPNINRFIEILSQHISQLKKELINDEHEVTKLLTNCNEKEEKIKDLLFTEFKFHKQAHEIRKKVVFFSKINLFYIQLQNLLKNISNKINDVTDIVFILDKETRTIESFDPSKQDLLSLKEALIIFGENAAKKIAMDSNVPFFDETMWYSFTTECLGVKKSLDILNDGANNKLIMVDTGDYLGQYWKIKTMGNGSFRLTNKRLPDNKTLGIINDGINNQLIMADWGNYPEQVWEIKPEFGFYRLTSKWLGERKSLGILNHGPTNKLIMDDTAYCDRQHWQIKAVYQGNT